MTGVTGLFPSFPAVIQSFDPRRSIAFHARQLQLHQHSEPQKPPPPHNAPHTHTHTHTHHTHHLPIPSQQPCSLWFHPLTPFPSVSPVLREDGGLRFCAKSSLFGCFWFAVVSSLFDCCTVASFRSSINLTLLSLLPLSLAPLRKCRSLLRR